MAITIPDRKQIRLTTDNTSPNNGQFIPAVAGAVITNPGPVAVSSTSPSTNGECKAIQALGDAGRGGYLGFNLLPSRRAAQGLGVWRNVIVEGFAGATPGSPVWVDATGADASGTASGLTHTLPTTGDVRTPIGVAISATRIRFH